jgi:DNA ligase-1
MKLGELAELSRALASTRSRREKVAKLAELLKRLDTLEIEIAVALLSGEPRQGRIGVGGALLRRILSGPSAGESSVELHEVDETLTRFAQTDGRGSARERESLLGTLFAKLTESEREFLARACVGELRQGALEAVVLEAIAEASHVPQSTLRRALMFANRLDVVARAALTGGEAALAEFSLQLLRPLRPMLADTAANLESALGELAPVAIEYKLDGARVQVHRSGSDVAVFSRQGQDVTARVPEIVSAVGALPGGDLVLDGEAIALGKDAYPLPFQTTMQRFGRQKAVENLRQELPLSQFYFDCLYLDGQLLLDRPNQERFSALAERVGPALVIPRRLVERREEGEAFVSEALGAGHEGVLIKSLAAPYDAGRRGATWLKLKPVHTLDLVVIAIEWGSGRRSGWLSNLHLAARDEEHGGFVMLGKTFKGMTDEMLAWQTTKFKELALEETGHVVRVRPEIVVEIAFDGVQASTQYPGGLSLRFARVRRYRPDKLPSQADTIRDVRAIFERSRR